ncbi:hypothetical protein [Agrococcus sp. Marseille-Q4369]|nr:hypothetical protein [Agrococcus sp. Marseille-Q4369]QUW18925.1 hypothetical protein JSQ78_00630 [Agrococcus sp. Marseille-Q4369]
MSKYSASSGSSSGAVVDATRGAASNPGSAAPSGGSSFVSTSRWWVAMV